MSMVKFMRDIKVKNKNKELALRFLRIRKNIIGRINLKSSEEYSCSNLFDNLEQFGKAVAIYAKIKQLPLLSRANLS